MCELGEEMTRDLKELISQGIDEETAIKQVESEYDVEFKEFSMDVKRECLVE